MNRLVKWVAGIVLLGVLVLGGVAVALQFWVGSDDFRTRVSQQVSAAAGVPVELGAIRVSVWPLPAVAVNDVRVKSQPPITLERIEARPTWSALLRGELAIATLLVRNAVIPQQAIAALGAGIERANARKGIKPAPRTRMDFLPRHVVLDQVTWVGAKGSSTVDADVRLDEMALPDSAEIAVTKGNLVGTQLNLARQPDHWTLGAKIGGGTVNGKVNLKPGARGGSLLTGQFETSNVEVAALTAPSKTLTGKLEAQTTLRAEVRDLGALADALQTQTKFTVRGAVVHGIDLAQAVKSVGMNRGGETRLDTLAGNVLTQGRAVQLNNLVATSGALSANGNVAMSPDKNLSGRVTVDLASAVAGGNLGVPLVVGGTLDSPSVTLSRGALIGAAIGTAIAPGVGTGGGAKLGDKLGESLKGLFGK